MSLVLYFDLKGHYGLRVLCITIRPFVVYVQRLYSYALCGICFRLGMAHFTTFDDITASLLKCVRIRF